MIELVHLNPNISKSDADKIVKDARNRQKKTIDGLLNECKTSEDINLISRMLPIILF